MKSSICRRRNGRLVLAVMTLALSTLLIASMNSAGINISRGSDQKFGMAEAARVGRDSDEDQTSSSGLSSYFNSARNLLTSGFDAHNQARAYSSLMPSEDPRTAQLLRDSIDKTSDLIHSYQSDGLTNMPPLPNVPGLGTLMRLPDKLLRAELSMLQDGIRMAQEMRERPLTATMNTPRGR